MSFQRTYFIFAVLIILVVQAIHASGTDVRGRIRDQQGRPLKNVTVTALETGIATSTDENGEFTIPLGVSTAPVKLRFEAPGYYPQTVVVEAGQPATPLEVTLTPRVMVKEEVRVVAPRLDIPLSENPAATTVVGPEAAETMARAVAADEALKSVPGVKVDNQANGERVHLSIRGQGILTERGIRGVQALLDGIPLNDPTGFVPDLFDVDWQAVHELQVIRGPVAFLYGGGSAGGVINISMGEPEGGTHGTFWTSGGSNAFYKVHADLSGTHSGLAYLVSASRAAGDGYRQHTAFWADNFYGKLSFNPSQRLRLEAVVIGTGFFNQNAEGLNLLWLSQDRRMANPDALTYNEYQKTIRPTGVLKGQWAISEKQQVSFLFFSRWTQYDEPVPSSVDHRTLTSPGGSVQYSLQQGSGWVKHHFSAGLDVDGQFISDHRHPNLGNAVEGGALLSDQSITQNRIGGYATERLALGSQWMLLAGVRVDRIGNRLQDRLRLNGLDLSGERIFSRASGRLGVSWNPRSQVGLYASWGQGFLPPATEELYANPAALGGFNRSLVPATSSGVEVGVRGMLGGRIHYDADLFHLDTSNDFERYRIAGRPLETFYGNAGRSRRYGVESSLRWLPVNRVTITGAYTYSNFIYTRHNSLTYPGDLVGDALPNSPAHQLFAGADLQLPRSVSLGLGTQAFSRAYIDPTNATWIDGYGLLEARLSKTWRYRNAYGTFFVMGKNLTDKQYIAFTEPDPDGNSYQPGAGREVFAGIQIRF